LFYDFSTLMSHFSSILKAQNQIHEMRPVAEQARVPCFRARLTIIPVSGIDIYSYLYVSPFYMFTQRKTPALKKQEFFLYISELTDKEPAQMSCSGLLPSGTRLLYVLLSYLYREQRI